MSVIKPCECQNEGQDKLHGKGKRVMNRIKPNNDKPKHYRCTVCGKERAF